MSVKSTAKPLEAEPEAPAPAFQLDRPAGWQAPLIFTSPHSGRNYPPDFQAASRLDPLRLRRSEDAFVDEIFAAAPALGAPLLRALFPRAYVDLNREAFELDPAMFEGPLPDYAITDSPRVRAGLGTIAKVVTNGENIYKGLLRFDEAKARIERCYLPYHAALQNLIDQSYAAFGGAVLIDCHSMPSIGGPMDRDPGLRRVDMVLGDCHGAASAPHVTARVETMLKKRGFIVTRNNPYAGGYTTRHYGQPQKNIHTLQIELNRALYMNETEITRSPGLDPLRENMTRFIEGLVAAGPALLSGD